MKIINTLIFIIVLMICANGCKNSTEPNTTELEFGTVTDIDGNTYKTVKIGDQWWMAENLKVTHDPEGNPITSYIYRNDIENENVYGRLYKWNVVMDGSLTAGSQGIAPDGWHIPSRDEWNELIEYIGGRSQGGGKLKEAGEAHWESPNSGADDSYEFCALPTGWRNFDGQYMGLGERCFFTTSSRGSNNYPKVKILTYNNSSISDGDVVPGDALPVRCIKD